MFDDAGGPLPADDFAQPIFDATLYDGERYGVVIDNHGWGMWVNNDLLEAAGLDPNVPPQTGQEFIDYSIALTLDENGLHPNEEGFDADKIVHHLDIELGHDRAEGAQRQDVQLAIVGE